MAQDEPAVPATPDTPVKPTLTITKTQMAMGLGALLLIGVMSIGSALLAVRLTKPNDDKPAPVPVVVKDIDLTMPTIVTPGKPVRVTAKSKLPITWLKPDVSDMDFFDGPLERSTDGFYTITASVTVQKIGNYPIGAAIYKSEKIIQVWGILSNKGPQPPPKPVDPVDPVNPVDPVDPVVPVDPLVSQLKAAYKADLDPNKLKYMTALSAIYRNSKATCDNPEVKTSLQLFATLKKGVNAFKLDDGTTIPATALDGERSVIEADLNKTLPIDATALTPDLRQKHFAELLRIGQAMEACIK